jgi:hypothetical protein
MICKCGSQIPEKRLELGYKTCVDCSTESRWTIVPVNYHKTGNTAEVIKDPEVAADFLFQSQRKSFGVLRGMTQSRRRPGSNPIQREKIHLEPQLLKSRERERYLPEYDFEGVGKEAMEMAEMRGVEKALEHIQNSLEERRIYKRQADQLIEIVNNLFITH